MKEGGWAGRGGMGKERRGGKSSRVGRGGLCFLKRFQEIFGPEDLLEGLRLKPKICKNYSTV